MYNRTYKGKITYKGNCVSNADVVIRLIGSATCGVMAATIYLNPDYNAYPEHKMDFSAAWLAELRGAGSPYVEAIIDYVPDKITIGGRVDEWLQSKIREASKLLKERDKNLEVGFQRPEKLEESIKKSREYREKYAQLCKMAGAPQPELKELAPFESYVSMYARLVYPAIAAAENSNPVSNHRRSF